MSWNYISHNIQVTVLGLLYVDYYMYFYKWCDVIASVEFNSRSIYEKSRLYKQCFHSNQQTIH